MKVVLGSVFTNASTWLPYYTAEAIEFAEGLREHDDHLLVVWAEYFSQDDTWALLRVIIDQLMGEGQIMHGRLLNARRCVNPTILVDQQMRELGGNVLTWVDTRHAWNAGEALRSVALLRGTGG